VTIKEPTRAFSRAMTPTGRECTPTEKQRARQSRVTASVRSAEIAPRSIPQPGKKSCSLTLNLTTSRLTLEGRGTSRTSAGSMERLLVRWVAVLRILQRGAAGGTNGLQNGAVVPRRPCCMAGGRPADELSRSGQGRPGTARQDRIRRADRRFSVTARANLENGPSPPSPRKLPAVQRRLSAQLPEPAAKIFLNE